MADKTTIETVRSFQAGVTNTEQAERQTLVRQAATSFALVVQTATRGGELRQRAIEQVRLAMLYALEAIATESGNNGLENRLTIATKAAAGKKLTAVESAGLRGMLGLGAPESEDAT